MSDRRTILITGATGRIGRAIIPQLLATDRYTLRSGHRRDHVEPDDALPNPVLCKLDDYRSVRAAVEGVDTVLHLAANAGDAPFSEQMVPNNIVGMRNLCEAAVHAGVRRILFASTNHVVHKYFHDHQAAPEDVLPRPDSLYGVTKAFGEILGRFYVENRGLPSFFSLRIGWFVAPEEPFVRRSWPVLYMWLSPRDFVDLVIKATDAPTELGYDCFNAVSDNDRNLLPIDHPVQVLGYAPQDNAERFVPEMEVEIPEWLVSRRGEG